MIAILILLVCPIGFAQEKEDIQIQTIDISKLYPEQIYSPAEIEEQATELLIDVAVQMAEIADNMDPLSETGKANMNKVISDKREIYKSAIEHLKFITAPAYEEDEMIALEKTAQKYVDIIEKKIGELDITLDEDGEIEGSGWLDDDDYDNEDFMTEVYDDYHDIKRVEKVEEDDGFSWWNLIIWGILGIVILVAAIFGWKFVRKRSERVEDAISGMKSRDEYWKKLKEWFQRMKPG